MVSTIERNMKVINGVVSFPMKEYPDWYGISGIGYIWINEWTDPQLEYNGKRFSCYIVEDTMWERYREECYERDVKPDVDKFGDYMRENADEVRELARIAAESRE